jgi:hypothetical protein
MDEDACRKRLTNYEAHTIRKIVPRDAKEKATWAKAEITREPLSQEDISKTVKRLNESKRTVQDKKAALMRFQQGQVNRLMDEMASGEHDPNFEWSLAQLDSKTFTNKKGQKETSTITVYLKRAPLKDVNPIGVFNAIERNKEARLEQMNRPPPRPEPVERLPPDHHPGIVNVGKQKQKEKGGKLNRPKKYHDQSSTSSDYSSSDEDSSSEYSSDGHTTISTHSDRRSRRYSHKGRSHSRPREHRRKYYIDERVLSPEPLSRHRDSLSYVAQPRYVPVPEVPQVVPTVPYDPVALAYQKGKIDADAERFEFDRYHRRSVPEPAAIVSYGRPERLERVERIYSEPRYMDDVRYVDDRDEDYYRREDQIRRVERRRREAEDYMDRRASDSRLEPKIIYTNPFAPRSPRHYSFTPSHSTRDSF